MKLVKKTDFGIHQVYNTNVVDNHNYISKSGIINHNCVVDSDYEGEIHIHLINVGTKPAVIEPGEKLVQFLLTPISHCLVEEVTEDSLFTNSISERGTGGFGSTGVS